MKTAAVSVATRPVLRARKSGTQAGMAGIGGKSNGRSRPAGGKLTARAGFAPFLRGVTRGPGNLSEREAFD